VAGVPLSCELVTPTSADAWEAYHDIRRKVLYERRGRFGVYDPNHPDDRSPNNFPKVLVRSSQYLGAVRIDFADGIAYLRSVAIAESHQRRGFGRVLINLAESFARGQGAKRVESAVASDAVVFYEKCGYRLLGIRGGSSVAMYKDLVAA
jgi:GNAT superfamily N-acetyltransferase